MPIEVKSVDKGEAEHNVDASQDVFLSITIGNGQKGASFIQDENEREIIKGSVTRFNLGDGNNLKGKIYTFFTNVLDVNKEDSDHGVIIRHRFSNINETFEYDDNAPKGGIFSLTVKYKFV